MKLLYKRFINKFNEIILGSISNIDGDECSCSKSHVRKVISGVVGAASSVTSIQVANLLRLFRIPQVNNTDPFEIPRIQCISLSQGIILFYKSGIE